jgi:hypothetical protein
VIDSQHRGQVHELIAMFSDVAKRGSELGLTQAETESQMATMNAEFERLMAEGKAATKEPESRNPMMPRSDGTRLGFRKCIDYALGNLSANG